MANQPNNPIASAIILVSWILAGTLLVVLAPGRDVSGQSLCGGAMIVVSMFISFILFFKK